jgi:WD40 repeat protein
MFIWDVQGSSRVASTIPQQQKEPLDTRQWLGLCTSPDGTILGVSNNMVAQLWHVPTRNHIANLQGHVDRVDVIRFSNDGHFVITGSWDRTVCIWNIEDLLTNDYKDESSVRSFQPWRSFREHRVRGFKLHFIVNLTIALCQSGIFHIFVSDNDRYLGIWSFDGVISVWDIESKVVQCVFRPKEILIGAISFFQSDTLTYTIFSRGESIGR